MKRSAAWNGRSRRGPDTAAPNPPFTSTSQRRFLAVGGQPVFDREILEKFLRRVDAFAIPVICGIWPLTSFRNAEFMVNELRVPVPPSSMERMRLATSADRARAAGVAI